MKRIFQRKNDLKAEYEKKVLIIESLNKFGNLFIENYCPLKITEEDFYIIYDLCKKKLDFIKEKINFNKEGKSLGILVAFAFESLFIDKYDLKINNLKAKIEDFELILDNSKDDVTNDIKEFVKGLKANNDKTKMLFKKIFENDIIYFIYLLIKNNKASDIELNEFLIKSVNYCCTTTIHFKYEILETIKHRQIINDLYSIFFVDKITNNFHLYIEDGKLIVKKFTNEELLEFLESNSDTNIVKKEEKKVEIPGKDEKNKIIQKQKNENENNNKKKKEENNINKQKKVTIEKEAGLDQHKKNIEKDFADYKINSEKIIAELNEYIYKLENENLKLKKIINVKDQKINELCENNSRIESDIKLIQLRRSLKMFVSYLYNGLKLNGDYFYESKITAIIEELKKFNTKEYNMPMIEQSINLMNKLYDKIELGNFKAHKIDTSKSIIDQIFELIDNKREYNEFKTTLKDVTKCNADNKIQKLVINREKNFLNKNELIFNEKKIIESISSLENLWKK